MLLYNVTVGIDKAAEQDWLQYIREYHIPLILQTGLFTEAKMFKVIHDQNDETISYSLQFFAASIEHLNQYLDVFAPRIVEEHRRKFLHQHVVFQTLLEEVR